MTSAYTADRAGPASALRTGDQDEARSDPKPGPASEVRVPLKDTSNPTNYVALFGAIAQILASTVAIIVVATKL